VSGGIDCFSACGLGMCKQFLSPDSGAINVQGFGAGSVQFWECSRGWKFGYNLGYEDSG
jgi:3-deoxy-D-manno-octulosonic acid (KDO) 8-phosphate synthase